MRKTLYPVFQVHVGASPCGFESRRSDQPSSGGYECKEDGMKRDMNLVGCLITSQNVTAPKPAYESTLERPV